MTQDSLTGLCPLPRLLPALVLLCASQAASFAAAPETADTIPIALRDNFPLLAAQVNGVAVRLKFDLGDGDQLALQQDVLDRIRAVPTGEVARFKGLYGEFEAPLYKVSRLQIGTAVFTDVIARLDVRDPTYQPGAQGEDGFLGTGLLRSFAVVLDYAGQAMTLAPQNEPDDLPDVCTGTAVPFSPVWNGQPVTEANIDLGRILLWWDTGSPVSALRKSLIQDAGQEMKEDTVTSRRLVLGGKDFGPALLHVWDMNLPGFDGFIGYDFFSKHVVCVDFPANRLIVGG
ncbi:MAG: hypothetical protein AB7T20_07270 [Steroidobacteraceae bacterium]